MKPAACPHPAHRRAPSERLAHGLARLRAAKLKVTGPRKQILGVLSHAERPLSSEEIFSRLSDGDLVTVYRTLQTLDEQEIVRRADLGDGTRRYELAEKEHHHHYVVCRVCKKAEPFDACGFSRSLRVLEELGYGKIQHTLEVQAVCRRCLQTGPSK